MKSYCISRLYDHQPSTDLKTYVMYYDEDSSGADGRQEPVQPHQP